MGTSLDEERSKVLHSCPAAHLRQSNTSSANHQLLSWTQKVCFFALLFPARSQTRVCHPRWSRRAYRVQADSGEPRSHDSAESPNKRCCRRDLPDTPPLPTAPRPPSALVPWTDEPRPGAHSTTNRMGSLCSPLLPQGSSLCGENRAENPRPTGKHFPQPATLCNMFKV